MIRDLIHKSQNKVRLTFSSIKSAKTKQGTAGVLF